MINWLSTIKGMDAGIAILICLFLIVLLVYFLPSLIALGRHHRQQLAICLLNLFAGWTLLGWLGALIWAVIKESDTATG